MAFMVAVASCRTTASSQIAASQVASTRTALAWRRPVRGAPVTDEERREATRIYIDLLDKTRYYAVMNERIHGWPASDPRYPWWGIWWTGVQIEKSAGAIAFKHHKIGSDNAASDTAMMLENACYAHLLWKLPAATEALHKLMRGMSAQIKAMRSASRPKDPVLLGRSFYPVSVVSHDDGRTIPFKYDDARPGTDNGATEYVHIPDNPVWGDIYVKNKRSKDDMGHVLRALAQVDASCGQSGSLDDATLQDWNETLSLYQLWATQVYNDDWRIATRSKSLAVIYPLDTLANFYSIAECDAMFSISMFGRGDGGGKDCGEGVGGIVDWAASFNDQNIGILESFHQAAVMAALKFHRNDLALPLMQGLVTRMEKHLDAVRQGKASANYPATKLAGLLLRNAVMGVPLNFGEARWLETQIKIAHDSFLKPRKDHYYDIEKAVLPDGLYPYNPTGAGLDWRDIGALVGLCVSPYVNHTGVSVLDCDMLRQHQMSGGTDAG